MIGTRWVAVAVGLASLAAPAAAEPSAHERRGVMGGVAVGAGDAGCDGCGLGVHAAIASAHMGGMLTPRVALLAELWLIRQRESADPAELSQRHTLVVTGARWWPRPRVWIAGGIGFGHGSVRVEFDDREAAASRNGFAVAIAAGFELGTRYGWTADLQMRASAVAYGRQDQLGGGARVGSSAVALGIGLSRF